MTTWNLARLRYTVRKITGKFDVNQIPDSSNPGLPISTANPSGIDDYLNDFYLYDFPECLRTLKLKDYFTFTTVPNCGTYNVPLNIVQLEPPIYIDNYQFAWYQSPEMFFRIWPEFKFIQLNLFVGDGSTTIFNFILPQATSSQNNAFPPGGPSNAIQQGTVVIGLVPNLDQNPAQSPQLETFSDQDSPVLLDQPLQIRFTNPGLLLSNLYQGPLPPTNPGVDPGTGTVDYLTGAVTVSYTNAPPLGTTASCHYHPYVPARPRDIMMFQQQLFLRPIPNDTYTVKVIAYFQPTVAISNLTNATTKPMFDGTVTDQTLFPEWWQVLAYGAALKIFIEDGEHQEWERYKGYFEEQKLLAQRKLIKQLANQRIQTRYAENVDGAAGAWPIFPYY